ncbi:MAG: 30S ribosome-binding factor RbfA [Candidatus Coprovivens sp.]
MNQIKLKRIGSQIQKDLMDICNTEAHDTLLKHITITAVEVTNDLGLARVFFTTTDTNIDQKVLEKELNDDTAGYLRNKIAERIEMRHIPKIRFQFDNSIAYGNNIERILNEIHEKDSE